MVRLFDVIKHLPKDWLLACRCRNNAVFARERQSYMA
jgi:hypothetical protein